MKDSYAAAKKVYGPAYAFAAGGGGVHPAANGHLMIACEILKALACKGDIGTIEADMKGQARVSAGHAVVSFADGVLVLDSSRYPFCYNYDPAAGQAADSMASILPFVPFSQDLNRLILKVTNLGAPGANVTWGSQTKSFTSAQLAQGVNLAGEFTQTPFDAAFARVMQAVADKQYFEFYMIKLTSNYNGNDNGGNADANMIAVHARKDAAVKALLVPVRHTIAIVPAGASAAAAPVVTGTMMAYATTGRGFAYQVAALHGPTGYAAAGLPKGLAIDAATGAITGTPAEPGVSAITLSATNDHGAGTGTLTLAVTAPLPARPEVTSPTTAAGVVGAPFTYQITASNAPTCYFATTPGAKGTVPPASSLPPGLTYDMASGLISGKPLAVGNYPIQVAAMNDGGIATALVTLTVKSR
jgi:hypothetical protein